jgi:hypothetical protein
MSRRRILPLALVVTALLAVVGIVAHGRPLGTSGGSAGGLPPTFWDYAFTTLAIFELLMFLLAAAALFMFRQDRLLKQPRARRTYRAVAGLLLAALIITLVGPHLRQWLHRMQATTKSATTVASTGHGKNAKHHASQAPRPVQFRWEEFAAVFGFLLVLSAFAFATRSRRGPPTRRPAPEVLAAALDESLDDLRADPDLSRAIVAAYARMETALAAAGLPRRPSEAPLEYVERALFTLDTSAVAVRRLSDLFEWARFSHHEPEPSMRDEAIDALVAVRDELRASELTPA